HADHVLPPARPALGVVDLLPHPLDRRLDLPGADKVILSHAPPTEFLAQRPARSTGRAPQRPDRLGLSPPSLSRSRLAAGGGNGAGLASAGGLAPGFDAAAVPAARGLARASRRAAVQRDAEDDQPDAGEIAHGGDLAEDGQADDGGGGRQQRE